MDVSWQAGGQSVDVDFGGLAAFWFEEESMACFVGEADDFSLDGGAISWAGGFDLTCIHGGSAEICSDQVVNLGVCVGDPAGHLLSVDPVGEKGEGLGLFVSGL